MDKQLLDLYTDYLVGLSRRSLYYQPVPPSAEEVAIKHAIDRLYTEQPSYGSRRIAVMLKERDPLKTGQPRVLDKGSTIVAQQTLAVYYLAHRRKQIFSR